MLKKNNIEAWLVDEHGNVIPHGRPTIEGNQISASVEIEGGKASCPTDPLAVLPK